jgi:four helix bundle protein
MESVTEPQLKTRTKELAIACARLYMELPDVPLTWIYGKQMVRSSSSVGASYRPACRARSDLDMLSKLGIVEEEADETQYWLEMLVEADLTAFDRIKELHTSYGEIVAMMVASRRTLHKRVEREGNSPR